MALGSLTLEEPCYGSSAAAIERNDETQPKYIRITDFGDWGIEDNHQYMTVASYTKKHLLKPNDILFARTGGTVGKTYFYDGKIGNALFAGYCIRFRFDENIVIPKYVYWYTKTSSYKNWVNGIQRPSGQPNINKEEYKSFEIVLPNLKQQRKLVDFMDEAFLAYQQKIMHAEQNLTSARNNVFEMIELSVPEYIPSLYSFSWLGDVKDMEIFCNPHSKYLNTVFSCIRDNPYYAGELEDFVEINPTTSRLDLCDTSLVSFVPMPAVEERTNTVVYETKLYKDVKTGFTIFQKDDLLWAKITPCMQNGKSFVATGMPTDKGFGSTEFHVMRKKDDRIYMPYLWVLLTDSHILEAAQGMFSGSAGQQRVSEMFLRKLPMILPPFDIQKKLADKVFEALEHAKETREIAEQEWKFAKIQFEKELFGEV